MRANLVQREPVRISHWEKTNLYGRIQERNADGAPFILHDGPPFTNGDVHIGTALNKSLKDIIVRYKAMRGFRTPYVPGWDCHGLPIEHKVARKVREEGRDLSPAELRRECEAFSRSYIEKQRGQFQRLGVLADWEREYRTLDPAYEATILRTFASFVRAGLVYRSKKPVYWSIPCGTALAEAEIEYKDHVSPSIYVAFKVTDPSTSQLPADTEVVIWTTTPWTIPANLAIALHPRLEYVRVSHGARRFLVARELAADFIEKNALDGAAIEEPAFRGEELEGVQTRHPFIDRASPVVLADYVTTDAGTGAVHTAPGHGIEDYQTGLKYGLEIYCPLDDDGSYVDDGQIPAVLIGKSVLEAKPGLSEANREVLRLLEESGSLVSVKKYHHSYPHCWRSKTPVVFRAMDQWFVALDHEGLRQRVLESVGTVKWEPAWGENRIRGSVENRPDWCISRQRSWGVPIPAFFDLDSPDCLLDPDVIEGIADKVETGGTAIWFEKTAGELLTGIDLPEGWSGRSLVPGRDTLDVWIDSGCSHRAVLQQTPDLTWPADLYLEGSDQHRGWFQSSLWTATIADGAPPYRQIITHGFIVGGDGQKISKSDGKPQTADDYIKRFGADVVRLWIASEDFRNDVPVSDEILGHISQTYRLIRNSLRFQIGNLYDFSAATDAVDREHLDPLDQWILAETHDLVERVGTAYDRFEFHRVYQEIARFFSATLSATYHDIIKDRLYTLAPSDPKRRSTQTALDEVFRAVVRCLAPILPFTTDEAWSYHHGGEEYSPKAVALEPWPVLATNGIDTSVVDDVRRILDFRSHQVNERIERLRETKAIGQSLEAAVAITLAPSDPAAGALQRHASSLPEWLIVSDVTLLEGTETAVSAAPATGDRCPRCWRTVTELLSTSEGESCCPRCAEALTAVPATTS